MVFTLHYNWCIQILPPWTLLHLRRLVRDATQYIILLSKDLDIMNIILQSEEDLRYRKPGKKLNVLSYPGHQKIALLVPEKLLADLSYPVATDF